jgi:hypothetical protein
MKSDHEKDMELIRKEAKAKVPEGYRRVVRGKIHKGDLGWDFADKKFFMYGEEVEKISVPISKLHYYIVRAIKE